MGNETTGKPNVTQAVPFFMVASIEKSLRFYVDALGFELKNKWEPQGTIEWCLIQLGGASLMLQEYRNTPPAEKLGAGVSICFLCDDALAMYHRIQASGLASPEPFVGNTLWVVGIHDPDNYSLYFESPTEVPEETTYSEWMKARAGE